MEVFSSGNENHRAEFRSGMRGAVVASTRVICRRSAGGEPVTPVYPYLFTDHDSCNLILACDGGRFLKVHKQVLSETSAYFARRLRDAPAPPNVSLLRVEGVSERVMKLVIRFMYLGKVTLDAKGDDDELKDFLSATAQLRINCNISKLADARGDEVSSENNQTLTLQERFDRLTSTVFAKCTNYRRRRREEGDEFGDADGGSSSSHSFMMSSSSSSDSSSRQISSASLETFEESSDDGMQSMGYYVPVHVARARTQGIFARGKNALLTKLKIINNKQSGTDKQGTSATYSTMNDTQGESSVNIRMPQSRFPYNSRNGDSPISVSRTTSYLEIHLRLRVALLTTRRMMRMPQGLMRRCFGCNCTRE